MPEYCVERIREILGRRFRKSVRGSRILMLGVAYKPDVDDCRESPAIQIMDRLHAEGADTVFYDPYVDKLRHHDKVYEGERQLTVRLVESADMVVVTTSHTNVDYGFVQRHAKAVFDTRNATKDLDDRSNIELL